MCSHRILFSLLGQIEAGACKDLVSSTGHRPLQRQPAFVMSGMRGQK